MDERRYIYAIYPYDEKGEYAGVYVGSTRELKMRLGQHVRQNTKDAQAEMHELMRSNGYIWQILETCDFSTRRREYEWVDFFRSTTDLKVFNQFDATSEGHTNIKRFLYESGYKSVYIAPMFAKGGVIWSRIITEKEAKICIRI